MTSLFQLPSELEWMHATLASYRRRPRPQTRSLRVDAMLDCIHERVFESDFDVAALRRYCGIRDNNHSTRFRQLVGKTPRAYIEHLRLEAASKLLRENPDANVLDIAFLVGYEHPQTFYRAFKRRYGVPPGAARAG